MTIEPDVYRVLQIDPSAETSVLRAAFRALARHYHPDGEAPDAMRMAAVNRAYALVRTPELRRAYDDQLLGLRPLGPGFVGPSMNVGVGEEPRAFAPFARAAERRGMAPPPPSPTLDFGRYTGWTLSELARQDPDYLRWLSRHSAGLRYREEIQRLLPNEPDLTRRANSVA